MIGPAANTNEACALPRAVEATLKLALAQHRRGELTLAEALYDQVLALDARNTDALHLKGIVALARGAAPEALGWTERACALLPDSALFHRSRAEALTALGRWSDAVAALTTAVTLKPDWAEVHASLGIAHAAQGDAGAAKAAFLRAVKLDPALAEGWSNLGVLHLADKEFDAAIAAFTAALKARPDLADAANGLGVALTETGRATEAIATFDRALTSMPPDWRNRADTLANRAVALQKLERWSDALADLTTACALLPGRSSVWRALAKSLTALGRIGEAEAACTRALALDPGDNDARYDRAFVRLLAGDIGGGFDDYRLRPTVDRALYPMPAAPLPGNLAGRRFRLVLEQGLGEHLFFLRYAASLAARGAEIAIETDPKMWDVLPDQPALGRKVGRDEPTPDFEPLLIGDLPFLVGATDAAPTLALRPDPAWVDEIRRRLAALGPAPYTALTWRAGIQDGKSLSKIVPLEMLGRAVREAPGTLISIQRGPAAGETERLARIVGRPVHDLSQVNDDLVRMLALLSLLDDYIGVSNTNMHLRAGLELPARVLIPHPPEFRWLAVGDRSPWFPRFALYRATTDGWNGALARLAVDLAQGQAGSYGGAAGRLQAGVAQR